MPLSTLTSLQPHFPSCQVPVWRRGKRDVKLSLGINPIYLGLMEHIYVFWWHFCLDLVIGSCPNVRDGFQYICTAPVLNHLVSYHEEAGAEEKQDVNAWGTEAHLWNVFSVSQTCKIMSGEFTSH